MKKTKGEMQFFQGLQELNQGAEIKHMSLENGTNVVLADMPQSPLTCIDFWCKAGSVNELEGEEGLAHFLEHMVFKGSEKLASGEFDHKIEALGGSSNAATGFDDVHFYVLVPPEATLEALELLLSLVLNPKLHIEAYSTEREVVLEEIAQFKDQPEEQVFQSLLKGCWGNHPYGLPILGNESSLKASCPEQMKKFHRRLYQGPNCCISIAGVLPKGIQNFIKNSNLSFLTNNLSINPTLQTSKKPSFKIGANEITVPRLESARLLMAWPLAPAKEQKIISGADIATSILAEGRRSKLIQRLREDLQLVESIEMDIIVLELGSLFLLEVCCIEKNLEAVEEEIKIILNNLTKVALQEKDLLRAQNLFKNSLCFNLEGATQVAGLSGYQTLWGRNHSLLEPLKHIKYWTLEKLSNEIFPLMSNEKSFTLKARPRK